MPNFKLGQSGSAIMTAMIAALSIGVVSAILFQQAQISDRQIRMPKVKSSLAMLETKVMEAIDSGTILRACVSSLVPNCVEVNPTVVSQLQVQIPGAKCSGTMPCGARLVGAAYNPVTRIFSGSISYEGSEISIKPIEINMQMSSEAWLGQVVECSAATPLLVGFSATGAPLCRALPTACPPGQYVAAVDPLRLTAPGSVALNCQPFPADVACPATEFLSQVVWNGAGNLTTVCSPRVNPFITTLGDPTSYQYAAPITPSTLIWMPAPVNGVCGPANGVLFATAPTTGLCNTGTATAVSAGNPWAWSCLGSNGGTNAACTAMTSVTTTTAPPGLCGGQILFPYMGPPGVNCMASPLPDDCWAAGMGCTVDNQVLLSPYNGCANVACVCNCMPGPTTTTVTTITIPPTTTTSTTTTTIPACAPALTAVGVGVTAAPVITDHHVCTKATGSWGTNAPYPAWDSYPMNSSWYLGAYKCLRVSGWGDPITSTQNGVSNSLYGQGYVMARVRMTWNGNSYEAIGEAYGYPGSAPWGCAIKTWNGPSTYCAGSGTGYIWSASTLPPGYQYRVQALPDSTGRAHVERTTGCASVVP